VKIYLAAPYSRKDDMNVYAQELRDAGFTVTSRWLDENHPPSVQMTDLTPKEHRQFARRDIHDVQSADAMVFFTDPTKTILRAGRHVEFGIILGLNCISDKVRSILVVGLEHENLFHYSPYVYHYPTWDAARQALLAGKV
jgi:nucleoside 2-deoxyribosyltransferase